MSQAGPPKWQLAQAHKASIRIKLEGQLHVLKDALENLLHMSYCTENLDNQAMVSSITNHICNDAYAQNIDFLMYILGSEPDFLYRCLSEVSVLTLTSPPQYEKETSTPPLSGANSSMDDDLPPYEVSALTLTSPPQYEEGTSTFILTGVNSSMNDDLPPYS